MFHIAISADRSTFAGLIQVLQATGNVDHLPALQHHGICSARDLDDTPRSALRGILGDMALDRLLARGTAPSATARKRRRDIPDLHQRQRGNLTRASIAIDEDDIDTAFQADKFAKTTQAPRESRWQTWQRMAAKRGLDPLPLTVQLVDKMGAAFKAGRYRSANLYFCRARQEHVDKYKTHLSADVEAAIKHANRSITRGMGPDKPKDSFCLELMDDRDNPDEFNAFARRHCYEHGIPEGELPFNYLAIVVLATWFLLRGLEIASAKLQDWTFDDTRKCLHWDLPISKTDTEGRGATRTHFCSCTSKPSLVCPYCSAVRHKQQLLDRGCQASDPLFPDMDGNTISKRAVARLAQAVALFIHSIQMGDWPVDQIQQWAEHAFRVSGAQMFARAGVDLYLIQLLGRWGSRAIERYVQEAPLANTKWAARAVANLRSTATDESDQAPAPAIAAIKDSEGNNSSPPIGHGQEGQAAIMDIIHEPTSATAGINVRQEVTKALADATWFIHNPKSKKVHLAGVGESVLASSDAWNTRCRRWRYGLSSHVRHLEPMDGYTRCESCFGDVSKNRLNEESEDSSSSD